MIEATKVLSARKYWPVAMLAAALAFSPVASSASELYSGESINLDLSDAHLEDVLATFSDLTGFVFAVDSRTAADGGFDLVVTVTYESVPWDRALAEILSEAGLEWTIEGKVLWIHRPGFPPGGDRNFTGDTINLRLEDAKLVDVLGTMSKVSGLGIDFDPGLATTVSVRLRSIPWDQALDLILRISGCQYTMEGDTLKVDKTIDSEGMQLMTPSIS